MPNHRGSMGYLPLLLSLWITLACTSRIQVQNSIISKTVGSMAQQFDDYLKTLSTFKFEDSEKDMRQTYYAKAVSMIKIWNSLSTRTFDRGLTGFSLLTGIQFRRYLQVINGPGVYFGLAVFEEGMPNIQVNCSKCPKRAIRKIVKYIRSNFFSAFFTQCSYDKGPSTSESIDFVYSGDVSTTEFAEETVKHQESDGISHDSEQKNSNGEKGAPGAKVILSDGVLDVAPVDFDCQLTYQNQNLDCAYNAEEQPNVEERLVTLLEGMKRGSSEPAYNAYPTTCDGPLYTQMGITDYQPISGCSSFEAVLNGSLFSDGVGRQVIVLVNADNWQHYKQGVLQQDMTDFANHYVLLNGMNKAENTWQVANSWGENWGENGYARVKMGSAEEWEVNPFCYKGYIFY